MSIVFNFQCDEGANSFNSFNSFNFFNFFNSYPPINMYNKFIITQDGELKFGNVFLHKDLLPRGHRVCHGGGAWKIDNQSGRILLYGRSYDFGLPDFEYAKRVNRGEMPGSLGYPMFYVRTFADEEVLEEIVIDN